MTQADSAVAFAAVQSIAEGRLDRHLDQIAQAVSERRDRTLTNPHQPPPMALPPGQVWVWMNAPVNRWEPRGTGVVL